LLCLSICLPKSFRYPQKQVYAVVADVSSFSQFVPFCIESKILSSPTPEPGSSQKFTLNAEHVVAFLSYKEGYISKVTCVPDVSVEVSQFILSCHDLTNNHRQLLLPLFLPVYQLYGSFNQHHSHPTLPIPLIRCMLSQLV